MRHLNRALVAVCTAILFSVTVMHTPSTAHAAEGKLWAVIVCCTPDLAQESEFLYETLTTYYNFTDIYYLHVDTSVPGVDAEATKRNVRLALNTTLAQWSGPDDIVFIYFMSHGGGWNMLNYWMCSPNTFMGGQVDLNGDEGNEVRESSVMPNPMDVNHDGDFNDWFGVDEVMFLQNFTELYLDDELASDLHGVNYHRLIFVYVGCMSPDNATAHCYSGGFIDDLSAPNRIIMTPSNETFPAVRKFRRYQNGTTVVYNMSFWGEQFISALGVNSTGADANKDGKVSMREAFNFATLNDPMTRDWHQNPPEVRFPVTETPWYDDNGNGQPTWLQERYWLDEDDGLLGYETHLGFNPLIKSPDVNGDHKVDIFDVRKVSSYYNSKVGDPRWNERLDLNNNGVIDIFDVRIVANYYGKYY